VKKEKEKYELFSTSGKHKLKSREKAVIKQEKTPLFSLKILFFVDFDMFLMPKKALFQRAFFGWQ